MKYLVCFIRNINLISTWIITNRLITLIIGVFVRTPTQCHTNLACNTSYHFAASRTVFPRVSPYQARDRLRILAHVYDNVASIHMTRSPG